MYLYIIMLFSHIVGVLMMFFAHGVIHQGIRLIRRAKTVTQLRERAAMAMSAKALLPLSNLLIFTSAIYMIVNSWNWTTAWINLSLVALLLMIPLGHIIIGRRVNTILKAAHAAPEGPLSPELDMQRSDIVLWVTMCEFTALAVGIAFLMVVKPGLMVSLIALCMAFIIGLFPGIPARRQKPLVPEKVMAKAV